MRTLLVTGGSGFVGKSLLDAFARGRLRAHRIGRVIALARRASSLRKTCPALTGPGVELVDADVRSLEHLHDADIVVHAAASADAARYREAPDEETDTIVEGTRRVVEVAAGATHRPRVLLVSSGAVYGRQPPALAGIPESAGYARTIDPSKQAYALAKRAAESLLAEAAARRGLEASIARCFAFVGPWLPLDRHFAAGDFLRRALARQPIVVVSRTPVVRSYLHADDLVDWLLRIAEAASSACPAYNVGSDEAVSVRDLAAMVGRMAGVPVELPAPADAADPVEVDRYVPDIGRARADLGLSVGLPLEQAFRVTLEAMRLGR